MNIFNKISKSKSRSKKPLDDKEILNTLRSGNSIGAKSSSVLPSVHPIDPLSTYQMLDLESRNQVSGIGNSKILDQRSGSLDHLT